MGVYDYRQLKQSLRAGDRSALIAHIYQGVGGVLVTTLMGAVLGLVFLATGSLIFAMAVHALMDLRLLAMPAPAGNEVPGSR
jgi:membrane protease YdiL (CAAX protease family)